jgi:hypothetical protein
MRRRENIIVVTLKPRELKARTWLFLETRPKNRPYPAPTTMLPVAGGPGLLFLTHQDPPVAERNFLPMMGRRTLSRQSQPIQHEHIEKSEEYQGNRRLPSHEYDHPPVPIHK